MKFFQISVALLFTLGFFTACDDDTADPNARGTVRFELTDAPSDDANVEAVFVTVVGVRIDGELTTTAATTVDLLALQNGTTQSIGSLELDADTYSQLELVLDYETDASGNAPGCYLETTDGTKHALSATGDGIVSTQGSFDVEASATKDLVIDFDVRRAVVRNQSSNPDGYQFVTRAELGKAVRFVTKAEAGTINGEVQTNGMTDDRIFVYAYVRGTFDQDTEISGQGTSNVTFAGATTSAEVSASGSYQLNFLESGAYELHYFTFADDDNDGRFELNGKLQVNALLGLDVLGLSLDAGADVTANVLVTGVTPL